MYDLKDIYIVFVLHFENVVRWERVLFWRFCWVLSTWLVCYCYYLPHGGRLMVGDVETFPIQLQS
jgi:hypothetical protein